MAMVGLRAMSYIKLTLLALCLAAIAMWFWRDVRTARLETSVQRVLLACEKMAVHANLPMSDCSK